VLWQLPALAVIALAIASVLAVSESLINHYYGEPLIGAIFCYVKKKI
jgi:hypothetical protein